MHEAQMHEHNSFVTLTYDEEHLPKNESLDVEEWKRFAKRLRHAIGPFRFFHCGEYGDTNQRPHYHAAFFGIDFHEDRMLLRRKRGANLYTSPLLQRAWGAGFVTIGQLTHQSAAYIARYVMKKITGTLAMKVHYGDRKPEYVTMSRRPGIGSAWFEKYHQEVYPADEVVHNGRKFKPPRYYDEKLDENQLMRVKTKRADQAANFQHERTPERLKVKETVHRARLTQMKRTL